MCRVPRRPGTVEADTTREWSRDATTCVTASRWPNRSPKCFSSNVASSAATHTRHTHRERTERKIKKRKTERAGGSGAKRTLGRRALRALSALAQSLLALVPVQTEHGDHLAAAFRWWCTRQLTPQSEKEREKREEREGKGCPHRVGAGGDEEFAVFREGHAQQLAPAHDVLPRFKRLASKRRFSH